MPRGKADPSAAPDLPGPGDALAVFRLQPSGGGWIDVSETGVQRGGALFGQIVTGLAAVELCSIPFDRTFGRVELLHVVTPEALDPFAGAGHPLGR